MLLLKEFIHLFCKGKECNGDGSFYLDYYNFAKHF